MNASLHNKINDLTTNGYSFESEKYIRMAWENFKKTPLMYIGYLVIFIAAIWVLDGLPSIISTILTPLLAVGFVLFAADIQQNKEAKFERFFGGFKPWALQLILVSIISSLIMGLCFLPLLMHVGLSDVFDFFMSDVSWSAFYAFSDGTATVLGILCAIPAIYLGVSWSWASCFVVFKDLDFWSAMEASRKVISKQWGAYFGFGILLALVVLLGLLCFGVGLFVAIPVVCIAPFIAFEQIIGLDEHEIDIIDHLIDDE